MKKKYRYFAFLILLLITVLTIGISYAWVRNTRSGKVNTEVVVSQTDSLLISINNGVSYLATADLTNVSESAYASALPALSLKDLTGDGIDLFSPVIDPFTKTPKDAGWKKVRTDKGDIADITALASDNENKNYLSFEVYFQANKAYDIYLSRSSFVLPSLNGKQEGQVLFLKRIAQYMPVIGVPFDQSQVTYTYVTDEITEPFTVDDVSQLPTVFNKSNYCSDFENSIDTQVFTSGTATPDADGYIRSYQTMYSSNYVCSCVRVAFIDEEKTGNYLDVTDYVDGHLDYSDSKLRMIWAPNPYFQGSDDYDVESNSHKYFFDIVNEATNPRKDASDNPIKDMDYYYCPSTGALIGQKLRFTDDIFVDTLTDGEDTVSQYANASSLDRADMAKPHDLITLTQQPNGKFEGKLRVVMWIEGSDPDAILPLTQGDSEGEGSGAGLIRFCLSFFGMEGDA